MNGFGYMSQVFSTVDEEGNVYMSREVNQDHRCMLLCFGRMLRARMIERLRDRKYNSVKRMQQNQQLKPLQV